tara:strand:+ start:1924 stop:3054 length:1131 start_codon:yes stop_codon:yes gene_type:complete
MKCAVFISDVGFGHMVRQRQIILKLRDEIKNIKITIFHKKNLKILKKTFGNKVNYVNNYNNITLRTTKKGFLEKQKAIHDLKSWPKKANLFLKKNEKKLKQYDFFISDLVPEIAFFAKKNNKPCFSVCHFTWDWFYKNLIKKESKEIKIMEKYTKMSTKIYFPPLTFPVILKNYKKKKNVNFITNKIKNKIIKKKEKFFKVLIMNNGTETLSHLINNIILSLSKFKRFKFFVSTNRLTKEKKIKIKKINNIVLIDSSLKKMYSFINKVDIVVARGGYNTISECLVLKKPSILSHEIKNPEVNENLKIMKKKNFSSTMNYKDWEEQRFKIKIESFLKKDYKTIKNKVSKNKFKNNGASQIVQDIKKELKKFYDKNYC